MRAALTPQSLFAEVGRRLRPVALAAPEKDVARLIGVSRAGAGRMRQGTAPGLSAKLLWAVYKLPARKKLDVLEPVLGADVADLARILSDLQSSLTDGRHALDRLNAILATADARGAGARLLGELAGDGAAGGGAGIGDRDVWRTGAAGASTLCRPGPEAEDGAPRLGLISRTLPLDKVTETPALLEPLARWRERGGRIDLDQAVATARGHGPGSLGVAFKCGRSSAWHLAYAARINRLVPRSLIGAPVSAHPDRTYGEYMQRGFDDAAAASVPQLIEISGEVAAPRPVRSRCRVLRMVDRTKSGMAVLMSAAVRLDMAGAPA